MKTAEELYNESAFKANNPNLPDHDKRDVIFLLNQCVSQFHPSPKEISEEEMREMAEEYQNKKANHFPYTDGDIENAYFDGLTCGLSLPSSGSKTEAVELTEEEHEFLDGVEQIKWLVKRGEYSYAEKTKQELINKLNDLV